jgi:hypothetical protein
MNRIYYLDSTIDPRDAFVVALRSAFKKAGIVLANRPAGPVEDETVVHLVLQVDKITVCAGIPMPDRRHEFLEDNPDMLEIAVYQFLDRARRAGK